MLSKEEIVAIYWLDKLPQDIQIGVIQIANDRKRETRETLPVCLAWVKENHGYEIDCLMEDRT